MYLLFLQPVMNETGHYGTELFTEVAERIIDTHNKSEPLYLYLGQQAVHSANEQDPLQAPQRLIEVSQIVLLVAGFYFITIIIVVFVVVVVVVVVVEKVSCNSKSLFEPSGPSDWSCPLVSRHLIFVAVTFENVCIRPVYETSRYVLKCVEIQ